MAHLKKGNLIITNWNSSRKTLEVAFLYLVNGSQKSDVKIIYQNQQLVQ
jgi:hypothetical protein